MSTRRSPLEEGGLGEGAGLPTPGGLHDQLLGRPTLQKMMAKMSVVLLDGRAASAPRIATEETHGKSQCREVGNRYIHDGSCDSCEVICDSIDVCGVRGLPYTQPSISPDGGMVVARALKHASSTRQRERERLGNRGRVKRIDDVQCVELPLQGMRVAVRPREFVELAPSRFDAVRSEEVTTEQGAFRDRGDLGRAQDGEGRAVVKDASLKFVDCWDVGVALGTPCAGTVCPDESSQLPMRVSM